MKAYGRELKNVRGKTLLGLGKPRSPPLAEGKLAATELGLGSSANKEGGTFTGEEELLRRQRVL